MSNGGYCWVSHKARVVLAWVLHGVYCWVIRLASVAVDAMPGTAGSAGSLVLTWKSGGLILLGQQAHWCRRGRPMAGTAGSVGVLVLAGQRLDGVRCWVNWFIVLVQTYNCGCYYDRMFSSTGVDIKCWVLLGQ